MATKRKKSKNHKKEKEYIAVRWPGAMRQELKVLAAQQLRTMTATLVDSFRWYRDCLRKGTVPADYLPK